MALRRPLWPKPRLERLAPPAIELRDPLIATRPAVGRRRFAAVSTAPISRFTTPPPVFENLEVDPRRFSDSPAPAACPELDRLLRAIRRKNAAEIYSAFEAWTTLLQNSYPEDAAVKHAQDLSAPVFSEIVRNLDPFVLADQDVGGGLRLTPGGVQFTSAARLVDEYGIRHRHKMVLQGMQTLMFIRMNSDRGLLASDYEVFMRCAGSAMDYQVVKQFWATMARQGDEDKRTVKTWTEFIKARFLTEPLYYQHDRTRIMQLARSMYRDTTPMPMQQLKRLDNMRLSLNAMKLEPWNRIPEEPEKDVTHMLRRRDGHRSYIRHWIRANYYGYEMNEELLCTSMIAFARSSSLQDIHTLIFRNFYKIDIVKDPEDPSYFLISGGIDIGSSSPIKPTVRMLDAIVEAFGSMSHIAQGLRLLDFISRRYNVPIPPQTWSNLLQWTYVCSSRPYQSMRRTQGATTASVVTDQHVREIWRVMTSKPYNVQPSFDDYDCYIKTLLLKGQIYPALDLIREAVLPQYQELVAQYEAALLDELLRNDVADIDPAASTAATHHRLKVEVHREHVRHTISKWFADLLKYASKNRRYRDGEFARVFVPDLLREFGDDFFHDSLKYRTAHGIVTLKRPDAPRRVQGSFEWRQTLPQKLASMYVHKSEEQELDAAEDAAEEVDAQSIEEHHAANAEWPVVPTMNVLHWRWRPREKEHTLGTAPKWPKTPEGAKWWEKLEERLTL